MTIRIELQIGFWIGAFLLLVLLLWLFSGVLLPFAAGGALANITKTGLRWTCGAMR